MNSIITLLMFSLLLTTVLAKKSLHKKSDKKIGFDDNENSREIEKKSYYRNKHFDHLSEEDLHKMTKLSPIAVSEDDIKLQADIDRNSDKRWHKTHHKSDIDLHLQDLNTHDQKPFEHKSNVESDKKLKVEEISDKTEDKLRKHKHSVHKKHEVLKDNKHKTKITEEEESIGKSFRLRDDSHSRDSHSFKHNKGHKHTKNNNKNHEKKSKKEFRKKYKKYNKYY